MTVGFIGVKFIEYRSKIQHEKFGDDDVFAFACAILVAAGVFLCLVSSLLIFVSAMLALFRKKENGKKL